MEHPQVQPHHLLKEGQGWIKEDPIFNPKALRKINIKYNNTLYNHIMV